MRGIRTTILAVCGALLLALGVAGCAGNESYPNELRPPATLTISVFIGDEQIAVSPEPFGAGPARFIIVNQTDSDQDVLLATEQFDREVKVGRGQTINFKQTVEPGELSISGSDTAADAKIVEIGPERESAQDDLNQP